MMCEKYRIETYTVPLIWAQKVKKIYGGGNIVGMKAIYKDVDKPIGPFSTGYEAGRAIGMTKNLSSVSSILNGKIPTIYGYRFYYNDKKELTFYVPNVKYAKENNLLSNVNKHTIETIEHDMKVCGFEVIKIGELKGSFTKIIVKCCNIDCDDTNEKRYNNFISSEQSPYCVVCSPIINSINNSKKNGSKSLADIRPDLLKYYHAEDNDGIEMNEITFGSKKKIFLRCNVCSKSQLKNEAQPVGSYTNPRDNGNGFQSNFTCSYCNSIGVKTPHLIKEWHEKNEKSPFDYSCGSNEKVWWKCEKNHEWETSLFYRAINNQNCPQCNNSKGEKAIAQLLDELNIEYIAQYPVKIGKSTRFFDFYIEDFNLFIEIHGLQHYENIEYFKSDVEKQQKIDKQKQQYAEKHGHYMMIDYREHSPELAVKRFEQQFDEFLDKILNDEVAI